MLSKLSDTTEANCMYSFFSLYVGLTPFENFTYKSWIGIVKMLLNYLMTNGIYAP